jgi:hypothetical protein
MTKTEIENEIMNLKNLIETMMKDQKKMKTPSIISEVTQNLLDNPEKIKEMFSNAQRKDILLNEYPELNIPRAKGWPAHTVCANLIEAGCLRVIPKAIISKRYNLYIQCITND